MARSPLCKHQRYTILEDQISKLPDPILGSILSLLTIKEAGRTSVLSNRWINLWKLTNHLKFDPLPEELRNAQFGRRQKTKNWLRSKYVTWVNQVLRSHECCSLEEFKVKFDLDASYSEDIDEWIKFIIPKRPKRMEIDLTPYFGTDIYGLSQECKDFFKSASNLLNIIYLRSLILGKVNVDGELIEYLLSECPHLETLSITGSQKLFRLKVDGPSIALKYLKLSKCYQLENIELSARSLVAFSYSGQAIELVVGENPLLSNLRIGGRLPDNAVTSCLPLFSRNFSQIESLSLRVLLPVNLVLPHVSGLNNLKHLMWKIDAVSDTSLLGLTKFMTAAPSLEKLTLQLRVYMETASPPTEEEPAVVQTHECLKEVEIHGYDGCRSHFELAMYLVKSAINLEKMVIDQSCPKIVSSQERMEKVARVVADQAEGLRRRLSPRAELIVIVV